MLRGAKISATCLSNVSGGRENISLQRGIDRPLPGPMSQVRDGTRGRDFIFIPPSSSHRAPGTGGHPVVGYGEGGRDPALSEPFQSVGMVSTTSLGSVMLRTAKCGPSRVFPLSLTPP